MNGEPAQRQRILIVDNGDPAVCRNLQRSLVSAGYDTNVVADGCEVLAGADVYGPDLIVLDVDRPAHDGLTLTRGFRKAGLRVPILMLTVRDSLTDRVALLDAGADAYLTKPVQHDELLARIRALLRRS